MKKSLFLLLLVTLPLYSVFAQHAQTTYDTTHRPRNFHLQVEQFKTYPNADTDIIFLGNSLTAGTKWNELLAEPNSRNRGISGDTTFGILERLDEVVEGNPAKIFLLIGINDISRNFPVETIMENHRKIVQKIKQGSPSTQIYLQTLLPVNNTFDQYPNHYNKDTQIAIVNKGLKQLARNQDLVLVDLHPHFLDQEGRLDRAYTEEGLHLNADGYLLWAQILKPYLE